MALVHSYTMIAKSGSEDALAEALAALGEAVKGIAGSQGAMVLRDRKEAQKFLFLEFWDNEDSRKAAGPQLPKEVMGRIMGAVGGPLHMADYDRLAGVRPLGWRERRRPPSMMAGQRFDDRILQPRRIAQRDNVAVGAGMQRIAVPVAHRAAGAFDHRHQRRPIVQLEPGLANEIEMARGEQRVIVAIAAHHHPLVIGPGSKAHEVRAVVIVEIMRSGGWRASRRKAGGKRACGLACR